METAVVWIGKLDVVEKDLPAQKSFARFCPIAGNPPDPARVNPLRPAAGDFYPRDRPDAR
jgi:hypothetical protein